MWEQCGVEILAFPLTWHIAYTTACCYRTSREVHRHHVSILHRYGNVEFSRLGTNVEVCVVVVECLVVLGFVFSVAASGATLLEGDSRKGFSIGVKLGL